MGTPGNKNGSTTTAKPNPLPLEHTLRDLAFLRASDVSLAGVLPAPKADGTAAVGGGDADSVAEALAFIADARSAVRTEGAGAVDAQGARLERVRAALDETARGLGGA